MTSFVEGPCPDCKGRGWSMLLVLRFVVGFVVVLIVGLSLLAYDGNVGDLLAGELRGGTYGGSAFAVLAAALLGLGLWVFNTKCSTCDGTGKVLVSEREALANSDSD